MAWGDSWTNKWLLEDDSPSSAIVADGIGADTGTANKVTNSLHNVDGMTNDCFKLNGLEGGNGPAGKMDRFQIDAIQVVPYTTGGWCYWTAVGDSPDNWILFTNGFDWNTDKGICLRYDVSTGIHPLVGNSTYTQAYTFTQNAWHRVVMTVGLHFAGPNLAIHLYIDGVEVGSGWFAIPVPAGYTAFSLFGGENNSAAGWILAFGGKIDDCFWADVEYTQQQVTDDFDHYPEPPLPGAEELAFFSRGTGTTKPVVFYSRGTGLTKPVTFYE